MIIIMKWKRKAAYSESVLSSAQLPSILALEKRDRKKGNNYCKKKKKKNLPFW